MRADDTSQTRLPTNDWPFSYLVVANSLEQNYDTGYYIYIALLWHVLWHNWQDSDDAKAIEDTTNCMLTLLITHTHHKCLDPQTWSQIKVAAKAQIKYEVINTKVKLINQQQQSLDIPIDVPFQLELN